MIKKAILEKIFLKDYLSMNKGSFLDENFSDREIEYCTKKGDSNLCFMGKLCAKTSVSRLIKKRYSNKDIEILNSKSGKPQVYLKGKVAKNLSISVSHTKGISVCYIILKE